MKDNTAFCMLAYKPLVCVTYLGLQLAALLLSDNISQIMQLCYSHMEINCLSNSTNFHLDTFQNIMLRLTVNPLKWKLCLQSHFCLVINSQWINFSLILYIYKFPPSEYFNVIQSAFHFANIWILNVLHQSLWEFLFQQTSLYFIYYWSQFYCQIGDKVC